MLMRQNNKINLLCISYKKKYTKTIENGLTDYKIVQYQQKIRQYIIKCMWDIDKSRKTTYNLKCNHN